jgi:response regulator RpfG family c-di-GMP phosphodiesterase
MSTIIPFDRRLARRWVTRRPGETPSRFDAPDGKSFDDRTAPASTLIQTDAGRVAESLARLRQVSSEAIVAWLASVVPDCPELVGHALRVGELSAVLAAKVGLRSEQVGDVMRAGLLHDVGRIASGCDFRATSSTDVRTAAPIHHPALGSAILRNVPGLAGASPIVAAVREHFDGTGYPAAVAGAAIPVGARVVAVADAFDAWSAEGVFRDRCPPARACAELVRYAGTVLDPDIVRVCLDLLDSREGARLQ